MKPLLILVTALHLYAGADEALRQQALSSGLRPTPADFGALLQALNKDEAALSREKIRLGKELFFEKALSKDRDISCATCHRFDLGGADAKPTAIGTADLANPSHLNTPTMLNTAFSHYLFWNGRSESLEDQAKGPMQAPFEMAITPEAAERRLAATKNYPPLFQKVFGSSAITFDKIADAIAAYEKTIVTRGRYDEFLDGNLTALAPDEKEGLELFITKSCVGCHTGVGLGGVSLRKFPLVHHRIWSMATPDEVAKLWKEYAIFLEEAERAKRQHLSFPDDSGRLAYLESHLGKKRVKLLEEGFFHQLNRRARLQAMSSGGCAECHDTATQNVPESLAEKVLFPFENQGGFLGAAEPKGYFRVPLLRNVVRTKPYFHNGSVEKLEDAIRFMARHQSRVTLRDEEIAKMIKFLEAADGEIVDYGE